MTQESIENKIEMVYSSEDWSSRVNSASADVSVKAWVVEAKVSDSEEEYNTKGKSEAVSEIRLKMTSQPKNHNKSKGMNSGNHHTVKTTTGSIVTIYTI
jgi:hypothetical protein